MNRMHTAAPLTAFLSLVVASLAFSAPFSGHSRGPDGVWNEVYDYPVGAYGLGATGTAFDPSREQLVRFAQRSVRFEPITAPFQSRYVAIRDCAGIPAGFSVICDPRRDRIVVLTRDS